MTHTHISWCLALAGACVLMPGDLSAQGTRSAGVAPPRAVAARTLAKPADVDKASAAAPIVVPEYRMGAGDKLRIEVYRDTQLSQSAQVRPDGKITLPLVGDIEASGKTPAELDDTITLALKEYVNNPSVTVIVVEATAATAYVIGGVNHPGAVPIQGNVTVLQALALAGGLTDFADRKNIRILRKGPISTQTITFNYKDAIKGSAAAATLLRAGDTVIVPD